ncbi:MAG: ATP-binding protein [Acidimicrobiia bacterium]
MVDRLVHHSRMITLQGDSYRLKTKHKEMTTTDENRVSREVVPSGMWRKPPVIKGSSHSTKTLIGQGELAYGSR